MSAIWLCSTIGNSTAHNTQAEAEAAAGRAKEPAVAWLCEGVEDGGEGAEAAAKGPRSGEQVVERVLSHLGLRTGTSEGVA